MKTQNFKDKLLFTEITNSYNSQKSYRKTAKQLHIPPTTLYRLLNPKTTPKTPSPKKPFQKIDKRFKRRIDTYIRKTPNFSIKNMFSELNPDCSLRNFYRYLHSIGYEHKKITLKPALTKKHKDKRMAFAAKHVKNSNFWHYVIFSDEKKFNLNGPDGYKKIWVNKNAPHSINRIINKVFILKETEK